MPLEILRTVATFVLAALFVFMGVLHFVPAFARGMSAMIPPRMKFVSGRALVRFTGLCEIAGGIGLLVPQTRVVASVALVVFLIAVFPANAYASARPETFGTAATPFWPRLVAQVVLIGLVVFVAL